MQIASKAVIGTSLLVALVLAIASYIGWCSHTCSATHNFRLLGLTFEAVGIVYFTGALALLCLSYTRPLMFVLAAGVGAELVFILVQKLVIGSWCPVCLSIASCVGVAALTAYVSWPTLRDARQFLVLSAAALASLLALSEVQAEPVGTNAFEKSLAFGKTDSTVEIYLFTDWGCPACHALEPLLPKIMETATAKAQVTFVDYVIHPETLNYLPYNLSFMVNNKLQYLAIRDALTLLSELTKHPSEEQVRQSVAALGSSYEPLNYADVAMGEKYFHELGQHFHVSATPTMVISDRKTQRSVSLTGPAEITCEKITKAIEEVCAP